MSSTSNVQDLLVNVFRPTYRYTAGVGFTPSLSLSNMSEVNTTTLKAQFFSISDSNKNTYIGSNAGVNAVNTFSNTAVGYSALGSAVDATNNVAVGTFALNALEGSSNNTAIGSSNLITGTGNGNILIGRNITIGDGSGNIVIGSDLSVGNVSKKFQLGTLLYGDLSTGYIGVNTSAPRAAFDISGITLFNDKVGFQNPNPIYSLDVNGSIYTNIQFVGEAGTRQDPLFTFRTTPGTGMFSDPSLNATYGEGYFGISTSGELAAVFSSGQVRFFQDLDVSGTFSARNVVLDAFSVQNGSAAFPTITFANSTNTGFFLVDSCSIGFTTAGTRKMVLLSNGDLSAGRLVTQDISYTGAITGSDPTSCNVIGGVTLCNGNVILTGVATNTNLLVPGWIRNTDPATALDISGGNISNSLTTRSSNFRGANGTVRVPTYSFVSDPSTGIHWAGTSQLAFDTSGVQRMVIRNGNVGIGTSNPGVALEVVGDVSAIVYNGPGGTATAPHYTFSDDRTTGVFFPGANIVGFTAGGAERMRISNASIGIGTSAPANALDVSGVLRIIGTSGNITFSNGTVDISGTQVFNSSGTLSNAVTTSNSIGGVTLTNRDISLSATGRILAPIIRNALIPSQFDISSGNISNSATHFASNFIGTTASASNQIGGVTFQASDLSMSATGRILAPIVRNALIPSQFDISSGNISNSATHFASNFIGTTASASNQIGGVTFSSSDLSMSATGRILAPIVRNALIPSQFDISGGTISNSATHFASNFIGTTASASNQIGGVTFQASDLSMSATGRILAPIVRNALIPSLFDISGGNISNSATTQSANFLGTSGGPSRPAYGFTSDPSSGLDLLRTSYLAFEAGGVQRMCISGGNVGIGTAEPATILDVNGSSSDSVGVLVRNCGLTLSNQASYGQLKIRGHSSQNMMYIEDPNSSTFNGWLMGTDSGTFGGGKFGLFRIVAGAAQTARPFTVDSTGLVGIGTTAPTTQLQVDSSGIGLSTVRVFAGGGGTASSSNAPRLQLSSRVGTGTTLDYNITGTEVNTANNYGLTFGGYTVSNLVRMDMGNGRVGINTLAPAYALDISGQGASILVGGVSSSTGLIVQGFSNTGYIRPQGTDGTLYLGGSNTNSVIINASGLGVNGATPSTTWRLDVTGAGQFAGGIWSREAASNTNNIIIATSATQAQIQSYKRDPTLFNDIIFQTANNSQNITRMTIVGSNGRVGISNASPGYMLDVTSDATTNAAINMSTWTRSTGSTTMACIGSINRTGNVYNWSNATPSMNTNLISFVASNGTTGGYFSILKSGIWAIHVIAQGQDSGAALAIDASNNTGLNGVQGTTGTLSRASGFAGGTSFTGYLSSNANMYYKIIGVTFEATSKNTKLFISFLQELPDISPTFPPP